MLREKNFHSPPRSNAARALQALCPQISVLKIAGGAGAEKFLFFRRELSLMVPVLKKESGVKKILFYRLVVRYGHRGV